MNKLFAELRRRNLFRVAGIYAVAGWIIMQVISVMGPALNLPGWVDSFFAVLLIAGLPVTMILAWVFEITPEGIKRTLAAAETDGIQVKDQKALNIIILTALALILAVSLGTRFVLKSADPGTDLATNVQSQDTGPSIAVLPFDDFSQSGDQEYFANGISEELLNLLARVRDLRVVSRTSAFSFKDREADVGEIAEALNVSHILEGSIRKSGTTLRITAQLIDTSNDQHLWSQTYDRALTAENIFQIQDEIAKAIVLELQGRIDLPSTEKALQTVSTDAYDAFLRGRGLIAQRTPDAINEGLAALNRAAALDPDFALTHVALVEAYILANTYAGLASDQAIAQATPHADRALELAPNNAESLAAFGWLRDEAGDYQAAIDYFERAIEINPNLAEVWRRLGLTYRTLDRFNEAKKAFERAYQLDPLSAIVLANMSITLANQGDLAASAAIARDAARIHPDDLVIRNGLADALWYEAKFEQAHQIWKDVETVSGRARRNLGYVYDEVGLPDLAATRANAEIQFVMALRDSKKAEAALLAREALSFQPVLLLWVGDVDAAYNTVKADIKERNLLSDKVTLSPPTLYAATYYYDALSARSDHDAEIFKERLVSAIKDRTPKDFQAPDSLYAGAKWHMYNNDPENALIWLNALIDRGHVWRDIDFDSVFDPIRDSTGFKNLMDRREEVAARHRAAILSQLADPDPDWVE